MIRIVVVLTVVFGTTAADAALSPFYQRRMEFGAILGSEAVVGALMPHGPIDGVEYVEPDRYRVKAGPCTLDVLIVDEPLAEGVDMLGARDFKVELGALVCN